MTKSKGKYYLVGGEHDMDEHEKLMDEYIKVLRDIDPQQDLALIHLSKHDYIKKALKIVNYQSEQLLHQSKVGSGDDETPKDKQSSLDKFKESLRESLKLQGMSEAAIQDLEKDVDKPPAKNKVSPAARIIPRAPSTDEDEDEYEDEDEDEAEHKSKEEISYENLKSVKEKVDALKNFLTETQYGIMSTYAGLPKEDRKVFDTKGGAVLVNNLLTQLKNKPMGLLKDNIIGANNLNDGTKENARKILWDTWIKGDSNLKPWDENQERGILAEQLQAPLLAKWTGIPVDAIAPSLEKFFVKESATTDFDVTTDEINIDVKSNVINIDKLAKITTQTKQGYISRIWNKTKEANFLNITKTKDRGNQPAERLLLLRVPTPRMYGFTDQKVHRDDKGKITKEDIKKVKDWWYAEGDGFSLNNYKGSSESYIALEGQKGSAFEEHKDQFRVFDNSMSKPRELTKQEFKELKDYFAKK